MTRLVAVVVAATVLLAPLPIMAEEPDVVPIMLGQPAPWSGLIVKEKRFATMLKLQLDVEELRAQLQIRERLFDGATKAMQDQLAKAQVDLNRRAQPDPWYKSHWFLWCLGFVLGIGAAVGAFYGASQLSK